MFGFKNIFTVITIFLSIILFQVYYYATSENEHKEIYKQMLVKEAKTYFENIMLKKAQGLDPKLTITNELTNVKFELLKEDDSIGHTLAQNKNKELYYLDDKNGYFYYFNLLDVKQNCIECHDKYDKGDTAGIIKVSIPTNDYTAIYENIHRSKYVYMILNIFFTVVIISLIVWFMNRSKKKHLQLLRSQRNLEKAEQMAQLGHWRFDNRTYEISFSKNMLQVCGLKNDKNINLKFIMKNIVSPRYRFKIVKNFLKSLKKNEEIQIEFQIIRQDDKKLRYVNCNITHIKNDEGIIVSIGTVQDLTSFIKLKNKLTILEQAFEKAPILIVITDEKANIEYVNPFFTNVTGYEPSEVIGKNPNILKSKHTHYKEYEKLWETIKSGKNWSGTFKNIKKNGEEFWEMAFISPVISTKTGKIIKYIAIKKEITSEVYLQQELKHKEDMMIAQSRHAAMGEMISMIAHQWRQPATVISLCASSILTDVILDSVDKKSLQKNTQEILDQTQYLSDTIDNFRNFFKPDKEKTAVTLKQVIKETKNVMNATLANNAITLIESYDGDDTIKTFKQELIQVFVNIIKNAQEILKEKNINDKTIYINEFIKNNNVIVQICDNAGGIEDENLTKIFEPYFSTKSEKNGTGLGLYICKVILEKHLNGTISAFNKDGGACFEIILNKED